MVADSKESACNAGYPGSIPGLRRFLGKGNGYPFQYSCLENSMDRGAWWAAVHGITKSQTGVSDLTLSHFHHRISLIFVCVCVCLCVCVCVCVCVLSHIQLFTTLLDCSPPGFSVHRIFQARILEWVAIFSSRGYFPHRD